MFAGTIGDLGCFSFFPSKNLGGFGDGGLVSAHSQELAARLRMLRMHGESTKYHHDVTGLNSRLDSLQAAVLSVKLKYLESWCDARIARAGTYRQLFMDSGLVGKQLPAIPPGTTDKSHVFNNYCIRAERRDELKQFLAEAGIQSEIYYPLPLHLQKCFADLGYKQGDFPHAELAAKPSAGVAALSGVDGGATGNRCRRNRKILPILKRAFIAAGAVIKIPTLATGKSHG